MNIGSRKVAAYIIGVTIFATVLMVALFRAPAVLEWIGVPLIVAVIVTNIIFISFNAVEKGMRIYENIKMGKRKQD